MNRQLSKGMTLIELMVVVLIIGILASIAYPSYRQYVLRANRTEAKTELLQLSQNLEKCYTRYNAYNAPACTAATGLPRDGEHYTIDANVDVGIFTLMATPRGGQVDDAQCGTLAIDSVGRRFERTDQAVVPANKCW